MRAAQTATTIPTVNVSKEKKLYPQPNSASDREIISMAGFNTVVRYNLTEDIEKTLRTVDEKQQSRLNTMKQLLQSQKESNSSFIASLTAIKDSISLKQQAPNQLDPSHNLSQSSQSQQYQQQRLPALGIRRSMQTQDANGIKSNRTSLVFSAPGTALNSQQNRQQQQQQQLSQQQQSMKVDMIAERNQGGGEEEFKAAGQAVLGNNVISEASIRQTLEYFEKSNWIAGITTSFDCRKVYNYNEDLVNGFYFKVKKNRGTVSNEFYLYAIDNLNELEYNPVVISNNVLAHTDPDIIAASLNCFCDILCFSTDQLFGFFQNFFSFVLDDTTQ